MNPIIPCYKLVGFINLYNTIPGFIYPIFSAFNKFYFQDGISIYIKKFYEVHTDLSEKIIPLKDLFLEKEYSTTLPEMFTENSLSVYVYQQSKDVFFMGDIVSFYNFINQQNKNVLIDDFLSENLINYKLAQKLNVKSWYCTMSSTFLKTAFIPSTINANINNLGERWFKKDLLLNYYLPKATNKSPFRKKTAIHGIGRVNSDSIQKTFIETVGRASFSCQNNGYSDCCMSYYAARESRNSSPKTYHVIGHDNYTPHIEGDHFRNIKKTNSVLYNKFCELIDEYSNICIDVSSENQKIEFVEKLLKKKNWLLTPTQYKIIINKYGKNYLNCRECVYVYNYSDLVEENEALRLLNLFLMDVIEDKNINIFDSIYSR